MKLSRSDEETANNSKISFSENESKNLIANYGVPVVREKVAKNFNEAKSISESIGFPSPESASRVRTSLSDRSRRAGIR